MFLTLLPSIFTLIYVDDDQHNHIYYSGAYAMRITQHNAFISDSYDDKRLLNTVRAVEGGFNLSFHCRKEDIEVNPYSNSIVLVYKRNTLHTNHMVHISIELVGGALEDVSMDEVEDASDYYTIVRIRMVGNDQSLEERMDMYV